MFEQPLDCKEIKLVNSKGNQPWTFIERTDAEAEAPTLCNTMQRLNLLGQILIAGKIEANRERGDRIWDG